MGEFVRLEVEDGVGTVRLDRPPVNALSFQVVDELADVAAQARRRDDVRAVVLWGGPKVFAAGADVKEMATATREQMSAHGATLQAAFRAVAELPQPVVAAVTGYALGGGCELALCADMRVAARDARLGQPEILLGVIPGAGGTQRLPRLVGVSRAKDLVFTGRAVRAEEALAIGLVDRVVEPDEVYASAREWAARLATGPTLALAAAKRAIDGGLDRELAAGLALETAEFAGLFGTEDQLEGMRSFAEQGPGKARFSGR